MERLHIVLDHSGSMAPMARVVVASAREMCDDVQPDGTVGVTGFSTVVAPTIELSVDEARARFDAPPRCGGTTALRDAIHDALRYDLDHHTQLASVTIAVVTDGVDNASRVANALLVRQLVCEVEAKGWRVVFLGANQDAVLSATELGIKAHRALSYDDARAAMRSLSASNRRYVAGSYDGFTQIERQRSMTAPPPIKRMA